MGCYSRDSIEQSQHHIATGFNLLAFDEGAESWSAWRFTAVGVALSCSMFSGMTIRGWASTPLYVFLDSAIFSDLIS